MGTTDEFSLLRRARLLRGSAEELEKRLEREAAKVALERGMTTRQFAFGADCSKSHAANLMRCQGPGPSTPVDASERVSE